LGEQGRSDQQWFFGICALFAIKRSATSRALPHDARAALDDKATQWFQRRWIVRMNDASSPESAACALVRLRRCCAWQGAAAHLAAAWRRRAHGAAACAAYANAFARFQVCFARSAHFNYPRCDIARNRAAAWYRRDAQTRGALRASTNRHRGGGVACSGKRRHVSAAQRRHGAKNIGGDIGMARGTAATANGAAPRIGASACIRFNRDYRRCWRRRHIGKTFFFA